MIPENCIVECFTHRGSTKVFPTLYDFSAFRTPSGNIWGTVRHSVPHQIQRGQYFFETKGPKGVIYDKGSFRGVIVVMHFCFGYSRGFFRSKDKPFWESKIVNFFPQHIIGAFDSLLYSNPSQAAEDQRQGASVIHGGLPDCGRHAPGLRPARDAGSGNRPWVTRGWGRSPSIPRSAGSTFPRVNLLFSLFECDLTVSVRRGENHPCADFSLSLFVPGKQGSSCAIRNPSCVLR